MNRIEFDSGWDTLCEVFERRPKASLAAIIYGEVQNEDAKDWRVAVQKMIDDSQRKTFPKLGEIKFAVFDTASKRREEEWEETKIRERREVEDLMYGPLGEGLIAENKLKIRKLINALTAGKAAVDHLAKEFEKEAKIDAIEKGLCLCNDGLVHYAVNRLGGTYTYIGSCSLCGKGNKNYPLVSPITGLPVNELPMKMLEAGRRSTHVQKT